MAVLNQIAYYQDRRDEVPNQELARELVDQHDLEGIAEIADNLWNPIAGVQSDCLKVLYEIGFLEPTLAAPYTGEYLKLLHARNNRLIWGSMIALSIVASLQADLIYRHRSEIIHAMQTGSVISVDNAVKVLAAVAAQLPKYRQSIFPTLLQHLETCRPKELAQHSESTLAAVSDSNQEQFIQVLEKRMPELCSSQAGRVRKVIRKASGKGG